MDLLQPVDCLARSLVQCGVAGEVERNRLIVPDWQLRLGGTVCDEQQIPADENIGQSADTVQVSLLFEAEPQPDADQAPLWTEPVREIVTANGRSVDTAMNLAALFWLRGLAALAENSPQLAVLPDSTNLGQRWQTTTSVVSVQSATPRISPRWLWEQCALLLTGQHVENSSGDLPERFWLSGTWQPDRSDSVQIECWLNNNPWLLTSDELEHLAECWASEPACQGGCRWVIWGIQAASNVQQEKPSPHSQRVRPWWKFW